MTKPPNDFESELTTEFYRFVATDPHWRNFSFKDLFEMGARWGYERGNFASAEEYMQFRDEYEKELTEARAEIAALDRKIVKHVDEKGELRALAARMAEALRGVVNSGTEYPVDIEALAAYEAFERGNK